MPVKEDEVEYIKVKIEGLRPGLLLKRFPDGAISDSSSVQQGERGTPREQAEAGLYKDENGVIGIPGQMVYAAIMAAGQDFKIGRRQITTKTSSMVPAGMWVEEVFLPLKHPNPWEVDSRAVVVNGRERVISHRPRFDEWSVEFTLCIDTTIFTKELTRKLVDSAGQRQGVGVYRPNRKGPFGRFVVTSWEAIDKEKAA